MKCGWKQMKKKKKKKSTNIELYQSIRKDWGDINPVTRVVRDKTKYTRKEKHKRSYEDC